MLSPSNVINNYHIGLLASNIVPETGPPSFSIVSDIFAHTPRGQPPAAERRLQPFPEAAEDQVVFHEPDFQAPVIASGLLAAGLRQRTRFTSLWRDRRSGYD